MSKYFTIFLPEPVVKCRTRNLLKKLCSVLQERITALGISKELALSFFRGGRLQLFIHNTSPELSYSNTLNPFNRRYRMGISERTITIKKSFSRAGNISDTYNDNSITSIIKSAAYIKIWNFTFLFFFIIIFKNIIFC